MAVNGQAALFLDANAIDGVNTIPFGLLPLITGGVTASVQYRASDGTFAGDHNYTWVPSTGLTIGGVGNGIYLQTSDSAFAIAGATYATTAFIQGSYDKLVVSAPNFSTLNSLGVDLKLQVGQNNYGTDAGGAVTQGKLTPIALSATSEYIGSGEHFTLSLNSGVYGMSDAFLFTMAMQYATGPINGDEGQGFCPNSYVRQQDQLSYGVITATPVRTTYSSTVTHIILGSKDPQKIYVASTAGATVLDWVVINQSPPDQNNLICATQIAAIGSDGTGPYIMCIVPINFSVSPSPPTVTPAMVLTVSQQGVYPFGQDRVLVNVSPTSAQYAAGNASQFLGTTHIGGDSSTVWTPTMVGGTATNIGAISFDADTYNNAPFNGQPVATSATSVTVGTGSKTFTVTAGLFFATTNSVLVQRTSDPHNEFMVGTITSYTGTSMVINVGSAVGSGTYSDWTISNTSNITNAGTWPLRSWYQIAYAGMPTFPDNHSLFVQSMNVSALGYSGNLPINPSFINGRYVVKPAARILLLPPSGLVICETTSSVWTTGDKVECAICPYPDVQGFDFRLGQWTPGGRRRQFMGLLNNGARTISAGVSIGTSSNGTGTFGQPGSDVFAFENGISMDTTDTGIFLQLMDNANAAFKILDSGAATTKDAGSRIVWDTQGGKFSWGKVSANGGLTGILTVNRFGEAALRAVGNSLTINPYNLPELEWEGWLRLSGDLPNQEPLIEFGGYTDRTGARIQINAATTGSDGYFSNYGLEFGFNFNPGGGDTHAVFFAACRAGKMFFGTADGTNKGVINDTTTTSAVRNVTWPDVDGGNVVVKSGTGIAPGSHTAAGTAGETRFDTADPTHLYTCMIGGGSGTARWFQATGSSAF